jgi:hypothetical protein
MPDFLRRLADRALGFTPTVDVRPSGGWAPFEADVDVAIDLPEPHPHARQATSDGASEGRQQSPNDVLGPGRRPQRGQPPPRPGEKLEAIRREGPPSPGRRPATRASFDHAHAVVRPDRAAHHTAPHATHRPADPQPVPRAERGPATTEAPHNVPQRLPAPLPVAVVRRARDTHVSKDAPLFSSHRSLSPPTPPVVEVTIGRLEVRAVTTATPPAPRPPSPAARLTLAEYLARRERSAR